MKHALSTRFFLSLAISGLGAVAALSASDKEPRWEAFVGLGFRSSADLTLRLNPRTTSGAAYDAAADQAALVAAGGAATSNVSRSYDNGSVGTASALGVTSNWSYQSASQISASSQTWGSSGNQSLYFTRNGALAFNSADFERSLRAKAAPMVELRRLWANSDNSDRGFVLGWTTLSARSNEVSPLVTARTQLRDEYFLYGVIPPAAPYVGPATPPGPLIDNRPQARTFLSATSGTSASARTFAKVAVQTFSFGGLWRSRHRDDIENGSLYFDLQAGLTANYAKLNYAQYSTILNGANASTFEDSISRHTWRLGYYASADASYPVNKTTSIVLRARYDELPNMRIGSTAATADADVSGWSMWVGATTRW